MKNQKNIEIIYRHCVVYQRRDCTVEIKENGNTIEVWISPCKHERIDHNGECLDCDELVG